MNNQLDKFYTLPAYSKKCIEKVFELYSYDAFDLIIEPSAGNGSFYHQLNCETDKIGIDIQPEHPDIMQQDYLYYTPPVNKKKIMVIGNPPFGRVSSTAVANDRSEDAETTAPRSAVKIPSSPFHSMTQ